MSAALGGDAVAEASLDDARQHFDAGRLVEAEDICRRLLRAQPRHAETLHLLARINHRAGQPGIAAVLLGKAIRIDGETAAFHNSLGLALLAQGKRAEALTSFRRAVELAPTYAAAQANGGLALLLMGQRDEAMGCFRQALALDPDLVSARVNFGVALLQQGELEAAISTFRLVLEVKPDLAKAHANLGLALLIQGRQPEAVASLQRARAIAPDDATAHAGLLYALHYSSGVDRHLLAAEARAWGRQHALPLQGAAVSLDNRPDARRRLRIGYVSADLRRHPVGYFLEAVLAAHDKTSYEVFCYSNAERSDDLTARLRAAADHWRSLMGVGDGAAARMIRQDGIDILVDLSGHTAFNRLLVFARKPAPVQATWLGYFDTTGVPAMDYLIADRFVCPPGDDHLYTEQVIRLPDSYVCYAPQDLLDVSLPPALARGYPTFGCCNNLSKITTDVVRLWSDILRAAPTARLRLRAAALDDPAAKERFAGLFAEQGLGPERVQLLGRCPYKDYLAAYGEIDIVLDPFPFNGGTTSVEALWMGVPIITLAGDHFVSRMGVSHLSAVGLRELIAASPDEYVAKAVQLAGDLPRLAALRCGLRGRLAGSSLMDGRRFTAGLEAAYRGMWEAWRRSQQGGE